MRNKINNQFGFTLLELIIVIGILAILATILIAMLDPFTQFQKSNDARRKSDLSQIKNALEQYYQDNGKYPVSDSSFQMVRLNGDPVTKNSPSWVPYMDVVPSDPNSSKSYAYYSVSPWQSYFLYASLDRGGRDPHACKSDGTACPNALAIGATCGNICNYGVSSPNVSP